MTLEVWTALALFAFVSAATPGPNNLLLLTSGLQVGFWKTFPFIVGVGFGFSALLLAVGYGLGQVFERFPVIQLGLKIVGTGYFLFLAWTLVKASKPKTSQEKTELDFWAGVLFQAVNPKAWFMCITAIALYLPPEWSFPTIGLMVVTFLVLGFPANMAWAGLGQMLRPVVTDTRRMRMFNSVMAVLLLLSILPVWIT